MPNKYQVKLVRDLLLERHIISITDAEVFIPIVNNFYGKNAIVTVFNNGELEEELKGIINKFDANFNTGW